MHWPIIIDTRQVGSHLPRIEDEQIGYIWKTSGDQSDGPLRSLRPLCKIVRWHLLL
jgi:hypothetical protein